MAEADKGAENWKARDKRPRAVNWVEDPRKIGARVYIFEFFDELKRREHRKQITKRSA